VRKEARRELTGLGIANGKFLEARKALSGLGGRTMPL